MALTKKKYIIYAVIGVVISTVSALGVLAAVDFHLHKKYNLLGGYNKWGYRGPIVGKKKPGEKRIVVLGGSTALGYGLKPEKSFPAYLERSINERVRELNLRHVGVVNLAYNNEGAYSFIYTLRDYGYLNYDIVILYTGYNDLRDTNRQVFLYNSIFYRYTGYLPIFPMIAREKYYLIRYGSVDAGYRRGKRGKKQVVFTGPKDEETKGGAEETKKIITSLGLQLGKLTESPEVLKIQAKNKTCADAYPNYCKAVRAAIDYALARGKRVVLVTQPYISNKHVEQQYILWNDLKSRYGKNSKFSRVNLGELLDLANRKIAYDGMHLTDTGNEKNAGLLLPHILQILKN